MPETPTLKLPYPEGDDADFPPADIQALAEATEAQLLDIPPGHLAAGSAGQLLIVGSTGAAAYKTMIGDGMIDDSGRFQLGKGAVGTEELEDKSVTSAKIDDGAVTLAKIGEEVQTLLGQAKKSIVEAQHSTESTIFTALSTPDRCSNIEVPANGLVVVAFRARVACTAESGRAAIAFNGGQARVSKEGVGSAEDIAAILKGDSLWRPLISSPIGLISPPTDLEVPGDGAGRPTLLAAVGDLTSGFTGVSVEVGSTQVSAGSGISNQIHGGLAVFRMSNALPESFNVEVQYKRVGGSGKVSAKERRLWVWTREFV